MPADEGDKTEPPTPRRRREARQKGQVARSQDLTAVVTLIVGLLVLELTGSRIWGRLLLIMQRSLSDQDLTDPDKAAPYASALFVEISKIVGPMFVIVMVAGIAVLVAQVGLNWTLQPLVPSLNKLNPISGIKRLFSGRSAAMMFINLGKLAIVGGVAYLTLLGSAEQILFASLLGSVNLLGMAAALVFKLGIRVGLVLLILALIDFAYQKYRHEKDLKMTKEEVKDELRSMEGDPVVKQRRRQVPQQLAMQRLRRDVPQADVVVTNPAHLAIAIAYDAETMPAPKVVAKGADYLALRIRQIAAQLSIPIVHRPPLARLIYDEVDTGQYIPEKFYQAIAEILAYVYRLSGKAPVGMEPAGMEPAGATG